MKKIIALFLGFILLVSCGATRYISVNNQESASIAIEVLYSNHPELVRYYDEGVLSITSLKEIRTETGYDYDIRYKFVKYYYRNYEEKMLCLEERFPELYTLYINGTIEITSLYKYVDRYGEIRYHASYRRLNEIYYDNYYHGGYRIHYRSRPYRMSPPPPPPKPRPNVGPKPRPDNPPRPRPNNEPNVKPRPKQDNPPQSRPNNSSNVRRPDSQSQSRPNNSTVRPNNQPSRSTNPSTPSRSNSNSGNGGSGGRRGR